MGLGPQYGVVEANVIGRMIDPQVAMMAFSNRKFLEFFCSPARIPARLTLKRHRFTARYVVPETTERLRSDDEMTRNASDAVSSSFLLPFCINYVAQRVRTSSITTNEDLYKNMDLKSGPSRMGLVRPVGPPTGYGPVLVHCFYLSFHFLSKINMYISMTVCL